LNILIRKHRPVEVEEGKWAETWDRSAWLLRSLAEAMKDIRKGIEVVDPSDFSIPNHYAKLAFHAGQKQMLDQIMSLLPKSAQE
jgi:hypothetical protein